MAATELPVYSVNGHKEIINCIDGIGGLGIGEGAPEVVTGSRDGTYSDIHPVHVWKFEKSQTYRYPVYPKNLRLYADDLRL